MTFDVAGLPLPANAAVFAASAAIIWVAGVRLALYADALAVRTGWGHAYTGLVLLALATDLPEVVTSLSAAGSGESGLAVGNLYGTIVANLAILAVADLCIGTGALTYFTPSVRVTIQGLLVVLLLSVSLAGMVIGEPLTIGGVGALSATGLVVYLAFIWAMARFDADRAWRPMDLPDALQPASVRPSGQGRPEVPLRALVLRFAAAASVTMLAGLVLAETAAALAHQSGLGTGFVGSTLLAAATSLPELTTTIGAVRLRAYGMAFGNIFGSNAVAVALICVVDGVDGGPPVLRNAGRVAQLGAVGGIALTVIYLVGLLTRQRRTFLRMGIDSVAVLVLYAAVLAGFFALR